MASNYTFSAADWPSKDKDGRAAHYKPSVVSPPTERGVLLSSSGERPAVHWQKLVDAFRHSFPDVLNEVSYFVPKKIKERNKPKVVEGLTTAFKLAFPYNVPAKVKLYDAKRYEKNGQEIRFRTSADNVRASDIVAAAASCEWSVEGQSLGTPIYVGLKTTDVLQALKFKTVPVDLKDSFIQGLPQHFAESFCPAQKIEVVDIWEQQRRTAIDEDWSFGGDIL